MLLFRFDNSIVVMTVNDSVFCLFFAGVCVFVNNVYKTVLSISNRRRVPHVNASVIRREIDGIPISV